MPKTKQPPPAGPQLHISNCTFNGGANERSCQAVEALANAARANADAIAAAANALKGVDACIRIEQPVNSRSR